MLEAGREDSGFRLRDRALHVFEEAHRVREFKRVCDQDLGAGGDGDVKLVELGGLMDASHASCSTLFECSCPELEDLVAAAKVWLCGGRRSCGHDIRVCCRFGH